MLIVFNQANKYNPGDDDKPPTGCFIISAIIIILGALILFF